MKIPGSTRHWQNWIVFYGGHFDPDNSRFAIPPGLFAYCLPFEETGLATVRTRSGHCGCINSRGEMVVPARFENFLSFSANGLAEACVKTRSYLLFGKKRWGFINLQGDMVIPPSFDFVAPFEHNGLATVGQSGPKGAYRYGFIDNTGTIRTPLQFSWVSHFAQNGLCGASQGHGFGFIDANGEWLIPPRFKKIGDFAACGLAYAADEDGKFGFITPTGEWAIPPRFSEVHDFDTKGLAWAATEKACFLINERGERVGNEIFHPGLYQETGGSAQNERFLDFYDSFADCGLALIARKGRYGFINTRGEITIPLQFDYAEGFFSDFGLTIAHRNKHLGYINPQGEWAIPPQFANADHFSASGYARVEFMNGNTGIINAQGKTIAIAKEKNGACEIENSAGEVIWKSA